MNLLLVVRSEILAIVIIVFLIAYDFVCAKYRAGRDMFIGFALSALGHVVMGLATEITVNTPSTPKYLNDGLHVLFFAFALFFSLQYFRYTLSLITVHKKRTRMILPAAVLCVASVLIMVFSPIDYLEGNGTMYSAGIGPTLCYMLGFVLFTLSDIILIANHKKIEGHMLWSLLPISIIGMSCMVVQILIPEFLFTGDALTLITVGTFFAIENPVGKFQNRAFMDLNTGVWNRNCYEFDFDQKLYQELTKEESRWIYVIGDINGLKKVNDEYGHRHGDQLIENAAKIMTEEMKSATKIYRIGGDEFVALYLRVSAEKVKAEIDAVKTRCESYSKDETLPALSISIGYADHIEGESITDTTHRADKEMYKIKEAYYTSKGMEARLN